MVHVKCPIIVIGPPRSGTSFTAKILIEYFGIRMGTSWNPLSEKLGHVVYEDYDLVQLSVGSGKQITWNEWKEGMIEFFDKMQKLNSPWGFKDPRVAFGLSWIIDYFQKNLTIIRCKRERELVLKSMEKKLDMKNPEAESLIDTTDAILDKALVLNSMPYILIEYKKEHYEPLKIANFLAGAFLS